VNAFCFAGVGRSSSGMLSPKAVREFLPSQLPFGEMLVRSG
jgi:hypothetical protein